MVPPQPARADEQGFCLEELFLPPQSQGACIAQVTLGPDFQVQGGDFHGPPGEAERRGKGVPILKGDGGHGLLVGGQNRFRGFQDVVLESHCGVQITARIFVGRSRWHWTLWGMVES